MSLPHPSLTLTALDWLHLFAYYLSLSLLAVGGAIATAPEMHRYLVDEQGWLSEAQFTGSVTLAQAAPGPNVLFIALLGWNVGLNAGGPGWMGHALGVLGMLVCMVGVMLPSTTLTWAATRWAHKNRERRDVRAFKLGMVPLVIGLLFATAWVLGRASGNPATDLRLWLLGAVCTVVVWKTRLHILWLLGAGALLGALGWV